MPKDVKMEFTIGGNKISLSKKAVEEAVKQVKPEPVKKYSVQISNVAYPIKQAVAVASGVPLAAFISTDAYRILTRLGFEVKS